MLSCFFTKLSEYRWLNNDPEMWCQIWISPWWLTSETVICRRDRDAISIDTNLRWAGPDRCTPVLELCFHLCQKHFMDWLKYQSFEIVAFLYLYDNWVLIYYRCWIYLFDWHLIYVAYWRWNTPESRICWPQDFNNPINSVTVCDSSCRWQQCSSSSLIFAGSMVTPPALPKLSLIFSHEAQKRFPCDLPVEASRHFSACCLNIYKHAEALMKHLLLGQPLLLLLLPAVLLFLP